MTACEYKRLAEAKVAAWLEGVDEATFEAALEAFMGDGIVEGSIALRESAERRAIVSGARRFFKDFSRSIVPLSNARCVYFAPDPRSRARGITNARAWAEYAVHAVTNGGAVVPGKEHHSRWYNHRKVENFDLIVGTLQSEQCVPVLRGNPIADAIKFFGETHEGGNFDVVVRLDEYGNAEANMTEVTFEASKAKKKRTPRLMPLSEAIEAVVCHQAAGTNPSTVENMIPYASKPRKGVPMTDISVIILTGKEEIHIRRCLEKLVPLEPKQVFVVESQKGDRTHEIAIEVAKQLQWQVEERRLRPEVEVERWEGTTTTLHLVWHDWPGLQSTQFNWALGNLPIEGAWVLRLDADEYLTEETIEKLRLRLRVGVDGGGFPPEVSGLNIELKRRFCGGEIRHGTTGLRQARIFRYGCGRCEERAMDEHICVARGEIVRFDGAFYDDNLNDMDWWREKHHGYAKREARDALAFARGELQFKPRKAAYYRYPRYLRAFAYFGFRYFVKKGILDGYAGWMWNFWQGLWYRCLVDYEIGKLKKAGG